MSILFFEKVFLKKRKGNRPLRGVEIFNLNLIRELLAEGLEVTVACEKSWVSVIHDAMPENEPKLLASPGLLSPVFCGLACASRAGTKKYDHLIIGNVGNGLIPSISLLRRTHAFSRMVLIAHREVSAKFLKAVKMIPGHVVSVCGPIAKPFSEGGIAAASHVDYGIMNAEKFTPCEAAGNADGKVRFCVLGALDNAWKGADTAIAAFNLLPDNLKGKVELHLKAYEKETELCEKAPGIFTYPWEPASTIPAFLRKMDVMIVPSRDEEVMRETFSQATVQGMLSALPIIYSPLPILKEKFDNGGGICFDTVESLAKAMATLASDRILREKLGKEARATALDRYVWQTKRFISRYL